MPQPDQRGTRCHRCDKPNVVRWFTFEGEVLEGKIEGALCAGCAAVALDKLRTTPAVVEREEPDDKEVEDEESEGAVLPQALCIRCGGPNADNPFSIHRQAPFVQELEGSLCGACARIVLGKLQRARRGELRQTNPVQGS